jgi:hypothetical protein
VVEQIAEDYPTRFAPLTMHVNDDGYDVAWGQNRLDTFYGLAGAAPTFMVDALWNCQTPGDYRYYVEQELAQDADMTLELFGNHVNGATWDITARLCHEGSSSRNVRVMIAPALDEHPELQRYATNVLMQKVKETDITIAGNSCENVTSRVTFDPMSVASSSDIVIISWAQRPTETAPASVYQAALMRWPFPAGSQLATIDVSPTNVTVPVGGEVDFTAVGKDQNGQDMPLDNPRWSLGPGNGGGSFDPSSGAETTFTATVAGTRQIHCTDGSVTGGALVTIVEPPQLAEIVIDPSVATVEVGGEIAFSATGRDQYGDDFPLDEPSWAVDGDGDGSLDPATGTTTTFTASYPGNAVVSCSQGDITATATVEIQGDEPRLTVIDVSPESAQLRLGESVEIAAAGTDQYGRAIALVDPAWRAEGDGAGAFDPASGEAVTTFTATGTGSVRVVCSDADVEGEAELTISAQGLPAPRKAGRRVVP